MNIRTCLFIFLLELVFIFSSIGYSYSQPEKDTFQKVIFFIDFTDYHEGSIDKWLKDKGFELRGGVRNRKKLDMNVSNKGLELEAKKNMMGIMLNEGVDLNEFSSIRLNWGIIKYPEGASYEQGILNEALMVIVFFGYDKISSGHFLIPNAPYFVGFFLGKDEKVGKSYVGRYFQKSGRYVCLGNPKPGEMVISVRELISGFKQYYEKDEIPCISGIGLSIDTTKSSGGGKAGVFIKSIEFLE